MLSCYRNLTDYLSFYDYVSARIPATGKTHLIFDELQAVEHWEKAIESFHLDFDVDIYITGSNAYLLFAEFSTLLSGRYVEIRLLPLSFKEFLIFYEFEPAVTSQVKGKNVAGKTVDKYISMLRSAFIFYSVGRYDVKGKQLLKTLGKTILQIWASEICFLVIAILIGGIFLRTLYFWNYFAVIIVCTSEKSEKQKSILWRKNQMTNFIFR